MFKKFPGYLFFLFLLLFLIGIILFSYTVKYYLEGGKRFVVLKSIVFYITEIPRPIINMVKSKSLNPNKPPIFTKHKNKKKFEQYIKKKRNALLVLPRYDHSQSKSIVEVVDLNNFEVLHTYQHDISEMNNQVKNISEFSKLKISDSPIRFEYRHPLILADGSLISDSDYAIEFKIDLCSNLLWINDQEEFHHSKMLDNQGNIWVPGQMKPQSSKYVAKYSMNDFKDDSIIKINSDGKILFNKSVTEILIENKIFPDNFAINSYLSGEKDPIHLNYIEPALKDTDYWKQGDLFLSLRHQSSIIHYRPSTNKIIKYLTGPFSQQHDVDIISDKEISIFNNNNFLFDNEYSEIIIYNFETKTFKKLFNDKLKNENFKTHSEGLSHILKDGSLMVEEQNHGRIILFNNESEKEWEFVNKDKNGDIGFVSWSRVIEDEIFIKKFKLMVKNKKCLN